eukprot:3866622-Prymnesium_polylepis.1
METAQRHVTIEMLHAMITRLRTHKHAHMDTTPCQVGAILHASHRAPRTLPANSSTASNL